MTPAAAVAPTQHAPLLIVGAGPIGLAAAAHAASRDLPVLVVERGSGPGDAVSRWGHVRLFSPWREVIDPVAGRLLAESGWISPDPDAYPTGAEWVDRYLRPLADLLTSCGVEIRYGTEVVGVARHGRDLLVAVDRAQVPFAVHLREASGRRITRAAAALVDASGTWSGANPLGGDGYPAIGEEEQADRILYGIPDLADPATRDRYAGRHVAVAGSGASAHNVLIALAELAREVPTTRITWLVRRPSIDQAFGGGADDELSERGALGDRARIAVQGGAITVARGFRVSEVRSDADGRLTLVAFSDDPLSGDAVSTRREISGVDEVVVVTGFHPDHSWLRQVHLDLDGELGSPRALAEEIHPAHHSCGSVSPHGADRLRQPERGLYLAGMKSYGRAPSFLALTGFEQVRSIVAEIAGDHEAAARVELVLPDTGVCGGSGVFDGAPAGGGCCGVPTQSEDLLMIGGPGGLRR